MSNKDLSNRCSLADHLHAALLPCQIYPLISPESLNHIKPIAAKFPGIITDSFGFECRLGESAAAADFFIAIYPAIGGRDILLEQELEKLSPQTHPAYEIWSSILEFTRQWSDTKSVLYDRIDNLWLEFDLQPPLYDGTAPSLFLGFTREAQARLRLSEDEQLHASCCCWLPEAIVQLRQQPLSQPIRTMLERLLRTLPPAATIFQVGVMLSRPGESIRLCIQEIPPQKLAQFLLSLGWQGSVEQLNLLWENLPEVEWINLNLDLADRVLDKIGLECYFRKLDQETAFINWLVQANLCLTEKATALTSQWGGLTHQTRHLQDWPEELIYRSFLKSPGTCSCFYRYLHHIKLVVGSDSPLQAKAYLAVRLDFLTHSELKRSIQQLETRRL